MSSYNQSSGYYTQSSNQRPMYATTQQQLPYGTGCQLPRLQQQQQYTYTTSPSSPPSSTSSQLQSQPDHYPPTQTTQTYHCLYPNCTHTSSRRADLERHVNSIHVRSSASLYDCEFSACNRQGRYGFSRKDKMIDHMREVHMADIPKRRSGGGR